jgi:hypothetical protein
MTTKTRYFVIASLLTLSAGLGAGLVAYYSGFSTSAFARQGGPDELQFVPSDAALVAYANVHEIMTSDLRQKIRTNFPRQSDGQHEFQDQTGINIETDIDHVVAAIVPRGESAGRAPGSAWCSHAAASTRSASKRSCVNTAPTWKTTRAAG